jgi:hypothetical protein
MPEPTNSTAEPALNHSRALYEARVHQQLQQWGLSAHGVQQLVQGRMPSDAQDRRLVTAIVAQAARD